MSIHHAGEFGWSESPLFFEFCALSCGCSTAELRLNRWRERTVISLSGTDHPQIIPSLRSVNAHPLTRPVAEGLWAAWKPAPQQFTFRSVPRTSDAA